MREPVRPSCLAPRGRGGSEARAGYSEYCRGGGEQGLSIDFTCRVRESMGRVLLVGLFVDPGNLV